jgi:hypothetical protein
MSRPGQRSLTGRHLSWDRPRPTGVRIRWIRLFAIGVMALCGSGCRVIQEAGRVPMSAVSAVTPHSRSGQPDPAALQADLQRYSDEYASRTVSALDDYARRAGTSSATHQALVWKLSLATACVNMASGANPTANLLDFLAFSTAIRAAIEEEVSHSPEADAFQPWLETARLLETNAWSLAQGVLKPEQQEELRQGIDQRRNADGGFRISLFVRPEQLTSLVRELGKNTRRPASVFDLVGLDPTAGLDPAIREVTRTRMFAERALYAAQRMPFLLRWQVELLASQLLNEPHIALALTNASVLSRSADRLSLAAESASQTAAMLPDRLTAERQAILSELKTQEGRLRELSSELSRTLSAGDGMFVSLNAAIHSLDALMERFGVGEPPGGPPDTNAPPFSILDYARAAEEISNMALSVDALIRDATGALDSPALDRRIGDVHALAAQTRADAKSVLNHAFLLAAGLIALLFSLAVIYRRTARPLSNR